MPIRIAYLEDFKGADTLLIAGDGVGMLDLAAQLQRLALGDADRVEIHRLPSVVTETHVELTVCR